LRRIMTIKYETLVSDPASTLRQIYAFLGMEPHPTTFAATTEHNQRYFAQWAELKKNPETSPVIERIIERLEARVRAFGYSLQDLEVR
jgi:hypothetical protein